MSSRGQHRILGPGFEVAIRNVAAAAKENDLRLRRRWLWAVFWRRAPQDEVSCASLWQVLPENLMTSAKDLGIFASDQLDGEGVLLEECSQLLLDE